HAAHDAGFRWDTRSRQAYKLPGHDRFRIDFSKTSARLDEKYAGDWRGISSVIYYGHVGSEEFARAWVRWAMEHIAGRRTPEPQPVRTPAQVKALEKS